MTTLLTGISELTTQDPELGTLPDAARVAATVAAMPPPS